MIDKKQVLFLPDIAYYRKWNLYKIAYRVLWLNCNLKNVSVIQVYLSFSLYTENIYVEIVLFFLFLNFCK